MQSAAPWLDPGTAQAHARRSVARGNNGRVNPAQRSPEASIARAASCDVLVIGGGPAGATLATLLARQGRSVVLLEKARHPRFHIGESLLPANVTLFKELGVLDQVERIGMTKWGVEFVSPDHGHQSFLEFADAWDKSMPYAWQVRRSELDELLFKQAAASGATTHEGCRVREVRFDADGADVQATLDGGESLSWRARFVIDASGRDTFLAKQLANQVARDAPAPGQEQPNPKHKNARHNSAALFGHFKGATRLQGKLEGNISIFWFAHGWFWLIPLADGSTSVGAVCWPHYLKSRDKPLPDFFADTIAMCPALQARLRDATLIDDTVYATGNYSYNMGHASGARYALLGDAYAFVDPVFSSGVYFAMASAFASVELVNASLDQTRAVAALRRRFEAMIAKGPREVSWFIYRMSNPAMRELFMYPANPMRVKEALLSLLAGDIYGRTPIWRALAMLKLLYYLNSIRMWPRTFAAWRARRRNVRHVGPTSGENVIADA